MVAVLDFLTLHDKHDICTLSVNIKFICIRCETGQKILPVALYIPRKHSLGGGGYIGIGLSACLSVRLSGPTSTSFVRFPPNFVEFKIMMFELCSIKDILSIEFYPCYASLDLEILRQFSMHFVIANSPT